MKKKKTVGKVNLVTLVWTPNTTHTEVVKGLAHGVTLSENGQNWIYKDRAYPVGDSYYSRDGSISVMGVYNPAVFAHIEQMHRDAVWATSRGATFG